MADFLLHLFPDMAKETLRHLVSYTKTKWNKTKTSSPSEQESSLLQHFNVTGVGPHLEEYSITRTKLLGLTADDATFSTSRPSNGLLLDLESFRRKEGATHQVMLSWWKKLTGWSSDLVAFRRMIKKTTDHKQNLPGQKRNSKWRGFFFFFFFFVSFSPPS